MPVACSAVPSPVARWRVGPRGRPLRRLGAVPPPAYAGPPSAFARPPAAAGGAPPPAAAPGAGVLPPPPVTTGRPAGPPGWEQARPVDRLPPPPVAPRVAPRQPLPPGPHQLQPGRPVPASESDWDAARLGHGPQGDPRIGRPSRSGTLLALLAVLAALTAKAPLVAVIALVGWIALARTADRSVTALVMRRHERGARGSDVAVAVASSPWHLVLGAVGALVTVALPLLVGVCAMFTTALVLGAFTGWDVPSDGILPLASAGVFAALTAWWGPGGASLRRGSRSIVRGVSPGATASQVAAALLLVVAAALVATTVAAGGPSWWPRSTAPGWVDEVVPTP